MTIFQTLIFVIVIVVAIVIIITMFNIREQVVTKANSYNERLEKLIRDYHNIDRIIMENHILDNHFDALVILFFKEYFELIAQQRDAKLNVVSVQTLVEAWVMTQTKTLSVLNNRHAIEISRIVESEMETAVRKVTFEHVIKCADDRAFEFITDKDKKIYLSNVDFLREIQGRLKTFNNGHKGFFL